MSENSKRKTIKVLPQQVIYTHRLPLNEIFTRLPVKSLLRFKSVSKYWLSLISDPKFVKDHYTTCAIRNPNDLDCLVANKNKVGLVILSRREETCLLSPDRYELIGSIHGIICLVNAYSDNEKKFWLWNPAIHQFKEFSFPPGIRRWSPHEEDIIGFGYDPVNNDYRVVFCRSSLYKRSTRSASVYSSNSHQWSDLIIPDNVFPANQVKVPDTIVEDCPYWTSFSTRSSDKQFVSVLPVKFDTVGNQFSLLPEFQCKRGQNIVLVNMMNRPTLMAYQQHSQNLSVGIFSFNMEQSGVWSKIYTVQKPIDKYFRRIWNLSQGFKCGEEIVFEEYGRFSYYDHKTDKISHIPGKSSSSVLSCFGYTPSLVFLKEMESDTKSNTRLCQLTSSVKPELCL